MTRHGYTVHVRSQRQGSFDSLERLTIYPRIQARILAGENDCDIARHVGISERTVARYRRRHGYTNPLAPRRETARG